MPGLCCVSYVKNLLNRLLTVDLPGLMVLPQWLKMSTRLPPSPPPNPNLVVLPSAAPSCLCICHCCMQNLLNRLLTVDLPGLMVLPQRLEISIPPSVTSIAEAAVGRDTIMRAVASAVLQVSWVAGCECVRVGSDC